MRKRPEARALIADVPGVSSISYFSISAARSDLCAIKREMFFLSMFAASANVSKRSPLGSDGGRNRRMSRDGGIATSSHKGRLRESGPDFFGNRGGVSVPTDSSLVSSCRASKVRGNVGEAASERARTTVHPILGASWTFLTSRADNSARRVDSSLEVDFVWFGTIRTPLAKRQRQAVPYSTSLIEISVPHLTFRS